MRLNKGGETKNKTADDVLAHYGILGMRWGTRRGKSMTKRQMMGSGPRVGLTKERTLEFAKMDLKDLKEGKLHLSYGLTKKRQAVLDKRDIAKLEKIIANPNELNNGKKFAEKLLFSKKVY